MRTNLFTAIIIAILFCLPFGLKSENKIDSILILLKNSIEKRGKVFSGKPSEFKKVERANEILCYLYPEFVYSCQNGENPCARTRITIHFIKNEFLRKDTFFYSGVYGQEKFAVLTNSKKVLKKDSYFVEIETPTGNNNTYYKTKKFKNVATWILYMLFTDNSLDNKKSKLYDNDMQIFMGVHIFADGIYYSKK